MNVNYEISQFHVWGRISISIERKISEKYDFPNLFPAIFVGNIKKKSLKSIAITNPSLKYVKLCKLPIEYNG